MSTVPSKDNPQKPANPSQGQPPQPKKAAPQPVQTTPKTAKPPKK